MTKQEFLAALDEARIKYMDHEISLPDYQSAIRIVDTAVVAMFSEYDGPMAPCRPGNYLIAVSKHFE